MDPFSEVQSVLRAYISRYLVSSRTKWAEEVGVWSFLPVDRFSFPIKRIWYSIVSLLHELERETLQNKIWKILFSAHKVPTYNHHGHAKELTFSRLFQFVLVLQYFWGQSSSSCPGKFHSNMFSTWLATFIMIMLTIHIEKFFALSLFSWK